MFILNVDLKKVDHNELAKVLSEIFNKPKPRRTYKKIHNSFEQEAYNRGYAAGYAAGLRKLKNGNNK